ncbi:hypothetical protein NESM_000385000 [Novymonas esmeraldas]|uniref:Uncharacterized protein n=1 Tax=Novymonas esmeraldas TaxID=1808958 RepID=A0AAW0EM33_9TRYP
MSDCSAEAVSSSSKDELLAIVFQAAMDAPLSMSRDVDPAQQSDRIAAWAASLHDKQVPAELVHDCARLLRVTTLPATGEGSSTAAQAGQPAPAPRSSSKRTAASSALTPQRVSIDTKLDSDHCTIARLLDDARVQRERWLDEHSDTTSRANGPALQQQSHDNGGALDSGSMADDIFSAEAAEQERWHTWAAVLREVKTEAAVKHQRQRQHGRGAAASPHVHLDELLDYLDVPETRWLLEDAPSTAMLAADIFMASRTYADDDSGGGGGAVEDDDDDDDDEGNSNERATSDMAALHRYLSDLSRSAVPPLRSLLSLTLASHVGGGAPGGPRGP